MKATNLLLRFLLELSALTALGYGGARLGGAAVTKLLFAGGFIGVATVAWMLFVAPSEHADVNPAVAWAVEIAVFAFAAVALAAGGRMRLAVVPAVV
jgi:hypothetical protein